MASVDHVAETICLGEGHLIVSGWGGPQNGCGGGLSDYRVDNLCWAHSSINPWLSQEEDT